MHLTTYFYEHTAIYIVDEGRRRKIKFVVFLGWATFMLLAQTASFILGLRIQAFGVKHYHISQEKRNIVKLTSLKF